MSGMAEVILMHSQIGRDENGQYCKGCGFHYGYAAQRVLHRAASAHAAHMLTATGFGDVREKQARLDKVARIAASMDRIADFNIGVLGQSDDMGISLRQHASDLRAALTATEAAS